MYLKNLTVLGFKSFADKTSLNFQPGVTAIVGPNGCGKSNVSDAIRWVLGEQSAKALRGGEMADVIFNGTDSRKPLGLAEVSLTLGGVDAEPLRAAGIPVDFNEVTLTRRVYRDGGSEYFLNKTSCRLRDIQQLFAGTGMGKTSYSIMAQGNITQILSSKPDDRRLVFEEAAGITRFKQQKREALRKLEGTEQNLLRVEDLIREVKRQIGSLQRQAGKARRFKAFQAELQTLDTQWARRQFDVLTEEIAVRRQTTERSHLEIEVGQETVLRLEEEILQLRTRLSELEHEISLQQQRGLELKAETERQESVIGFNQQRLAELADQNARAAGDIVQSSERRSIAQSEQEALTERLAASQVAVERLRAEQEVRREALSSVERELSGRQEELRRAQAEAFSASQGLGRVRNEINQLALQLQGNVVRLEKLNSEKIQFEEERIRLEMQGVEFTQQVEAERVQVQTSRMTLEERQQRLKALQSEIQQATQERDGLLRQQAEKRSKLGVLEQLATQHEGFGAGALAALKQSRQVVGSLADRLKVPDAHVVAVEAALGNHLQIVLAEQPAAASEILADLSTHRKGRASIAALSLVAGVPEDGAPVTAGLPDGVVSAASVVEAEPSIRPLVAGLLGRTLIVPDLDTAMTLAAGAFAAWDFVTPAGELLNRLGVFTGGAQGASGKAPASILGRKNQIAELQAEIAALQETLAEASRRQGALQSEQTALQAHLEQVRTELRQQEVAVATRQGEFNALQAAKRSLEVRLNQVDRDLDNLATQEAGNVQKRESLAAQVAEWEQRELHATTQVAELSGGLEDLRNRRDGANQAFNDAKIALATEEQLLASHQRQRGPLETRIRELSAAIERLQTEQGQFEDRRANFEAGIGQCRREIERLAGQREILAGQTQQLLGDRKFQEGEIQSREEQLKERRARVAALQNQRSQTEVELAQKTLTLENLRARLQEKYQVALEDIRPEGIRIQPSEEGLAKVELVPVEVMDQQGWTTDWEAVAAQIQALQRKVDDIGPVNLVAIEEYEESEQRHAFLQGQYDDLVKAKSELVEVINRINTETKTLFVETFEKIRTNFQAMFTEMFGGGRADLKLTEGEDVLEAGIDIVARPPGKQLQSISLLSGGEQTMTAVALLFSIYQVKPSPFCVLDELDAPLDESNINRFTAVLKRFLDHSQFVVITHNKRTISMADVLYGVTMQERGVSKIVSVRFNKDEGTATPVPEASSGSGPGSGEPAIPAPQADLSLAQ
jgi:chromosome segregation protein